MVISLGPGKFYGSSLPRPRIYTDVKFNDERVDPPASVIDPLLAWATDAHWSMGGLNFKRLRHQGRIEGNVKKLVAERESIARKKKKRLTKFSRSADVKVHEGKTGNFSKRAASLTPPPAPISIKRRKYMAVSEEEEEAEDLVVAEESGSESSEEESGSESSEEEKQQEEEAVVETMKKKKKMPVRKLYDEFNKVARESKRFVESNGVGGAVMKVVRDLNKEKTGEKSASIGGTRTSPRLSRAADSVAPRPSRRLVTRG